MLTTKLLPSACTMPCAAATCCGRRLQDVLGEVEFALPAVLTAKGKCLTLELTRGATPSKVMHPCHRFAQLWARRLQLARRSWPLQCMISLFIMQQPSGPPSPVLAVTLRCICQHNVLLPCRQVSITAEEVSCARDVIHMSCSARKLASVEVLSKSDPFFDISRLQEDGKTWVPVYKSEVVDNNLNPDWRPVTVRSTQLCNGDIHRPLQVRVSQHSQLLAINGVGLLHIYSQLYCLALSVLGSPT